MSDFQIPNLWLVFISAFRAGLTLVPSEGVTPRLGETSGGPCLNRGVEGPPVSRRSDDTSLSDMRQHQINHLYNNKFYLVELDRSRRA